MSRQRGLTLVELVLFIVLTGIAFGALLLAINQFVRGSADPLIRKQALAIAESLMDEVSLMPFTFCDPDDANSSTATSSAVGAGGCATTSEDTAIGAEAGEARGSTSTPFDNVSDYNGFSMSGIRSIEAPAVVISGLGGYSASVTVAQAGADLTLPAAEVLRITVTVTPPSGDAVVLDGYRARYAPRTSQ